MATIREMVRDIQKEVRDTPDLLPDRAAALATRLSALLGNVNDEIRAADAAYAATLLSLLESEKAANRARIRAEMTPEYARKREARDTKELAVELIRTLKYFMRAKEQEYEAAKNL